eukprot:scaffold2692_cov135-Ochromonas_danica.AAC.2
MPSDSFSVNFDDLLTLAGDYDYEGYLSFLSCIRLPPAHALPAYALPSHTHHSTPLNPSPLLPRLSFSPCWSRSVSRARGSSTYLSNESSLAKEKAERGDGLVSLRSQSEWQEMYLPLLTEETSIKVGA